MKIISKIPASFIKRVIAYILDMILVSIIVITPFKINFKQNISNLNYLFTINTGKIVLISIIIAVLIILYFAIFEYLLAQTIGKMIMNIEVISGFKELKFSQALLRNLTKFSGTLILIDCINILISRTNKRFLEQWSDTEVILR